MGRGVISIAQLAVMKRQPIASSKSTRHPHSMPAACNEDGFSGWIVPFHRYRPGRLATKLSQEYPF